MQGEEEEFLSGFTRLRLHSAHAEQVDEQTSSLLTLLLLLLLYKNNKKIYF